MERPKQHSCIRELHTRVLIRTRGSNAVQTASGLRRWVRLEWFALRNDANAYLAETAYDKKNGYARLPN